MPVHYNPSIAQDSRRIFNLKAGDNFSPEILPNIQPVMQISRVANIVREVGSAATGTFTIFTTPADKDFYLTGAMLSFTKDAASDLTTMAMNVVIAGATRSIVVIPTTTLVAGTMQHNAPITTPILVDRGTTIGVTGTFTVGTATRFGLVQGFTVETISPSSQ